ncbi:hypothetical protein XMM379_002457 [Aliiroseovarius sp. xm-m-379]|uniref:hypothetical protein n=1 Tax=unclassified Aliiroseovarius TaxID=2623558 RepID=UPI0015691D28|nr:MULTISPECIES: hypothetical protein [unclassified Aliiroseovarius]NRP62997.1 hypothetical protein [Aliiroseovarius sp. xm-a-151]NRQ05772.1 hypothetical protein [Aliiroseovarius sp. xm-m-309]NRP11630.1 hypothetical protein [Aliiroseovarius sp. xm-d-517]NRP25757.1 hypothetical protein [Aliiroseovarius sp. xm-m-379]NRP31263.1 hypothetical protein [Aliiroseovarius sp. xm-m-314]
MPLFAPKHQKLAPMTRSGNLFSRLFTQRRSANPPRTIRHWTPQQGFVEIPVGC